MAPSAALVHLLQDLMRCKLRGALLHTLPVISDYLNYQYPMNILSLSMEQKIFFLLSFMAFCRFENMLQ